MDNNIYNQEKKQRNEKYNLIKEIGKTRKYFLESSEEEKKERFEQTTKNREYANMIEDNKTKQPENVKRKNKVFSKQGKKFIKRAVATIGAIGLIISGTNATIGKVNEIKEQNQVDSNLTDDYNGYMQDNLEKDNIVMFNKNELNELKTFYSAINTYENSKNLTEIAKAKAIIIEYMENRHFEKAAKTAIDLKLKEAVLYGEYIPNTNEPIEVVYIDGKREESDMIRIKSIDKKYYSMNNCDIFSEDIPDNLRKLSQDIFELQNKSTWKSEKECIEVAVDMSEHLGTVVQEHYTLDENADITRISNEDYEIAKHKYELKCEEKNKKIDENIYNKYGINVNDCNNKEKENEL